MKIKEHLNLNGRKKIFLEIAYYFLIINSFLDSAHEHYTRELASGELPPNADSIGIPLGFAFGFSIVFGFFMMVRLIFSGMLNENQKYFRHWLAKVAYSIPLGGVSLIVCWFCALTGGVYAEIRQMPVPIFSIIYAVPVLFFIGSDFRYLISHKPAVEIENT